LVKTITTVKPVEARLWKNNDTGEVFICYDTYALNSENKLSSFKTEISSTAKKVTVFDFLEGEVEYDGKVWNLKPGC
jgi:hypothetical protein